MKNLDKITNQEINLLALHNTPLPFLLDADQPGHQYHHEAQDLRVRPFLPDPIVLQFPPRGVRPGPPPVPPRGSGQPPPIPPRTSRPPAPPIPPRGSRPPAPPIPPRGKKPGRNKLLEYFESESSWDANQNAVYQESSDYDEISDPHHVPLNLQYHEHFGEMQVTNRIKDYHDIFENYGKDYYYI